MANFIDLTGHVFGRLTVDRKVPGRKWLCVCECGQVKAVRGTDLKRGRTQSCGCLHMERITTHGASKRKNWDRLYTIWDSMRKRCRYKRNHNYAGRGISVCPEWSEYAAFRDWALLNGYADGLTLDRVQVDEGYSPGNCRWLTTQENNQNQRRTRLNPAFVKAIRVSFAAGFMTMAQMSRYFGVSFGTISKVVHYQSWTNIKI